MANFVLPGSVSGRPKWNGSIRNSESLNIFLFQLRGRLLPAAASGAAVRNPGRGVYSSLKLSNLSGKNIKL